MAAFPDAGTLLESDNTRHFFSTITDNLQNQEMKAVLQQKIAQLVPSTAWIFKPSIMLCDSLSCFVDTIMNCFLCLI